MVLENRGEGCIFLKLIIERQHGMHYRDSDEYAMNDVFSMIKFYDHRMV